MKVTETLRQVTALSLVKNAGPIRFRKWMEKHGSPAAILKELGPAASVAGLLEEADREIARAQAGGAEIITCLDGRYPPALKEIYDPPVVLYVKGSLPDWRALTVAIVGSRRASHYGQRMAAKIAADLARSGVTVVSGLAAGIDTAAHRGCLSAGGMTVAVLGGGLSDIYPAQNLALSEEIARKGALISEYPMGMSARPEYFPSRNRILSGISGGIVVAEAHSRSGALITASAALEQGRDVFAVPGPADEARSAGSNALLKDGAKLVTGAEDILREFFPGGAVPSAKHRDAAATSSRLRSDLTEEENRILSFLDEEPVPVDAVIEKSGFSAQKTVSLLTVLEMKGALRQTPGKNYARLTHSA